MFPHSLQTGPALPCSSNSNRCVTSPCRKVYPQVHKKINPEGIYREVTSWDSFGMDVFEIRKKRLRELINSNFDGVQRRFADAIDRQPDYVSRILKGTKRLGEQLARDIESTLGLPPRWLDAISPPESATQGQVKSGCASLTDEDLERKRILEELARSDVKKLRKILEISRLMDRDE